ncbi:MAG: hypothetical protein IJD00_01900 [Clostridia bacterium]|nr:hypothetical protein [Clostridia bacterium]MBQ3057686.1 hypothetical protein [Clostridia bacterium]
MKFWDCFIKVIIIQGITVFIVLASVLILKFGFSKTYKQFFNWYSENVMTDTNIYEVIE